MSSAQASDAVAADLASIDAADTELVLRRAIQLADDSIVVAERFPVDSIGEVAAELHVPAAAVADALAEYRAGALDQLRITNDGERAEIHRSLLDRLVGPGHVSVTQRTGLSEEEAVEQLDRWLKRRHRLRTRVDTTGTVVAVRRRGVVPVVIRSVRTATGSAGLAGVKEVRAAAVGAADGPTSLCVVVDVSDSRAQSVAAGSVVTAGGALIVTAAVALGGPVALVGAPVVAGVGWATSRLAHRYRVRHVVQEAEMTADQVAAGDSPVGRAAEVVDRLATKRRSSRS